MDNSAASTSATEAIARIKRSAASGKLIAVIGTGVSLALTNGKNRALSWKGLIENGFEYGAQKGMITETQMASWRHQLDSSDIDDILGAAEFMSRKLDAPKGGLYARWLESVFKEVPAQPVDATQVLNLSAGVSNCKVSRGRSFS